MTATPVVQLHGVSKRYESGGGTSVVLKGVDLSIMSGEKASLVGPSGCGKSTLLLLIAGLLRPDEGTIEVESVALSGLDERARARIRANRIGIALQSDNLVPYLDARENVELALAFASPRSRRPARTRALELLEQFGVAHRAGHRPRQLSGGEAQRVALAVSMANEPVLLLADEVVAQLDADTAAGVIDDVLTADFALLYVTHDSGVADLADRRYELVDHGVHLR
ncbi:ABC transporter ATP-binding protein [soil metagenome]